MAGEKNIVRIHLPNVNSFDASIHSTTLSVADIVSHCRYVGYFVSNGAAAPLAFLSATQTSRLYFSTTSYVLSSLCDD